MLETSERPWGKWEDLLHDPEQPYRVKKITVNPGEKTSVQYHLKRAERWTVIEGKGKVFVSNLPFNANEADLKIEEIQVEVGSYVEIPLQHIHSTEVAEDAEEPLVFVEVQIGLSTEEDIVRLEDRYGRLTE
jgi:mannose-6-phosphate isomerase